MFCLSWWKMFVDIFRLSSRRVVGFPLKIHRSSPELDVMLLKHLVMTQAVYQMHITCDSLSWGWPFPGKLDFVYFQTVPYIYMGPGCDDTSVRWKCFQCLWPSSKGLMETSTGGCDTGSTLGQSSPVSPALPKPLSPCYPSSPPSWG